MKRITALLSLFISISALSQVKYDEHFTDDRWRIDFMLCGDARQQTAALSEIHFENSWSGTKTNLIDPFEYGSYYVRVYESDTLIYSTGFCSLFEEWLSTEEANHVQRAYSHSVRIPEPLNPVRIELWKRSYDTGLFDSLLLSFDADPNDKLMVKHGAENNLEGIPVMLNADCEKAVDIVFVAEGYSSDEMIKFSEDVYRFTDYMFDIEPYKSHKNDFNVWMVHSVSADSGVDIPHEDIWKQTATDSHFYSLYIDRYLTLPDQTKLSKLVANSPCDAIYVLANTNIYGGGGIYNCYAMCAADSYYDAEVCVHEFGHSFAGLGDEYYEKSVTYEDYLNTAIEPWEPNVTTLVNFEAKWKDMVKEDVPIPTPDKIEYANVLGAFEGASYVAQGAYRPVYECRMKVNEAEGFCPVCQRAIVRMIDYYCR